MNSHQLVTRRLVSGYEGKTVVNDVSIEIPQGKVSAIIGANGCGKSTLLKSMTRIIEPFSGQVLLDEQEISKYPPKELACICGMLPQNPIVPDGVTVSDLVMRGRYPHQKLFARESQRDYEVVYDAMEIMGLLPLADHHVNELSGGQRQRVWIATALAQETDILFLDEPTTFLDINYQVEILDIMARLNKEKGKTIVMVLHDINMACRYCDYIFAVKEGQIIAEGKPGDIMTADLIRETFNLNCQIIEDPISHTPYVIPISKYLNPERTA